MPDRVLWLGTQLTTAPRSGGAIRSLRLLEALARHAEVDLVTTEPSGGDLPVASHHRGAAPGQAGRALAVARGWPRATARSCAPSTIAAARRLAPTAARVVVEWVHLFPLVPPGPYVLATHNVEADRSEDPRLVRAERRLVADPRATVLCVSERDRDLLGPGAQVVPNGTDVPPATTPVPDDGPLLFVGAMDYAPNRLAVEWWAREVWRPALPPLTVAGRAADTLPPLDGVESAGEVESVAPLLDRAALVVVPLHHGGGTRLKVLEAMAANRPVLSTAKGVEGLDVTGACVVADEAPAFAAAVRDLLADPARRRALAAAGRAVAERHDWRPIGERFAELVLSAPRRG
ncbi:MAG TPA: glycosyltransferase [Frankiaceae bacterium]|nr:glycosyltransferase [Frankiaceae bacterium]